MTIRRTTGSAPESSPLWHRCGRVGKAEKYAFLVMVSAVVLTRQGRPTKERLSTRGVADNPAGVNRRGFGDRASYFTLKELLLSLDSGMRFGSSTRT